jgi:hypothetical protein
MFRNLSGAESLQEGKNYMFQIVGPGKAQLTGDAGKIPFWGTAVDTESVRSVGLLKLENFGWDRKSPYNIKDIKTLTINTSPKSSTGYSAILSPSAYQLSISPVRGGRTKKRKSKMRKTKQRKTKMRKY